MAQAIAAKDVTLRKLKQNLGLKISKDPNFFSEWSKGLAELNEEERHLLDRVKANFLELMEDPPMLENTVKLVILASLLDLDNQSLFLMRLEFYFIQEMDNLNKR